RETAEQNALNHGPNVTSGVKLIAGGGSWNLLFVAFAAITQKDSVGTTEVEQGSKELWATQAHNIYLSRVHARQIRCHPTRELSYDDGSPAGKQAHEPTVTA
ncbi:hypothetical protein BKA62DRAFT_679735, partial [Auriculariales sp. MPI-PUGE-AT-0066]